MTASGDSCLVTRENFPAAAERCESWLSMKARAASEGSKPAAAEACGSELSKPARTAVESA